MNYGYLQGKSLEDQRLEIFKFAEDNHFKIDEWIEENSGVYNQSVLTELLSKVQKGDLIICSELTRLGCKLYMIMDSLTACMQKGCKVWTVKENYRLEDPNLAQAFSLSSKIERDINAQRTKDALKSIQGEGVVLGRPKGRKSAYYKLSKYESTIQGLLKEHIPVVKMAKMLKVNRGTLTNFLEFKGWKIKKSHTQNKES